MGNSISVTILTKNSQKHISACLGALQKFTEIIVLDNGSTDNTLAIVKQFSNVKVYSSAFIGFGPLKNLAAQYASNSWVLSIDSDEIMTDELTEELLQLDLSKTGVVYSIKRNNYYRSRLIKACGWDNDYVLRLYHKSTTAFADLQVHEYVRTEDLYVQRLTGQLQHYAYDSISQLIAKSDKYTTLFATENRFKKRSSAFKSYYKGAFSFFKNYILQRGFLYGYEGLTISFTNASYSFYKYMKLHEANRTLQTTLIIISPPDKQSLKVIEEKIKLLKSAPEEVIIISSLPYSDTINNNTVKINNVLVPVLSYHLPSNTITEVQKIITTAIGEFIIIENGTTLTPDLIDSYKLKVQQNSFNNSPLTDSNYTYSSGAFWKADFLKIDVLQ